MVNKTIDFYNKNVKKWIKEHSTVEQSYSKKMISKFKELLPKGKILEIGCGSGRDARNLVNIGFDYIGIDASSKFIKLSKKISPNINFLEMEAEKLSFPKDSFDGFWSSATLLHIPKNRMDKVLKNIKNVCKKGSVGFISLKEGENEIVEEESGRWFSFYKKSEFEEMLVKNQIKVIYFEKIKDWRENKPDWLIFYVKII